MHKEQPTKSNALRQKASHLYQQGVIVNQKAAALDALASHLESDTPQHVPFGEAVYLADERGYELNLWNGDVSAETLVMTEIMDVRSYLRSHTERVYKMALRNGALHIRHTDTL